MRNWCYATILVLCLASTVHADGGSPTGAAQAPQMSKVVKVERTSGNPYTLSSTLTGQTGTITFTGKLTGVFSQNNSNLTNVFVPESGQSLALGGNTYTVTIGPYTPGLFEQLFSPEYIRRLSDH